MFILWLNESLISYVGCIEVVSYQYSAFSSVHDNKGPGKYSTYQNCWSNTAKWNWEDPDSQTGNPAPEAKEDWGKSSICCFQLEVICGHDQR